MRFRATVLNLSTLGIAQTEFALRVAVSVHDRWWQLFRRESRVKFFWGPVWRCEANHQQATTHSVFHDAL